MPFTYPPARHSLLLTAVLLLAACQSVSDGDKAGEQLAIAQHPEVVPSAGLHSNSTTSWFDSIQSVYNDARTLVEDKTGTDLSEVRLSIVSDEVINDEVSLETKRLVKSQFSNPEFSDNFLSMVMKGQAGTYAALYTSRQKAILISTSMLKHYEKSLPANPSLRRSALLTLLIHELVHAADDQRYAIHENRSLNFRASFAQSATFEGHAQWVTRQICAVQNCLDGLDALDTFMFNRTNPPNQLTQTVQAISRNVLEYSYVEGERFIDQLSKRENGDVLIDQLLRNPPQDPIEILAPEKFPNTTREARNQKLLFASKNIDHSWTSGSWAAVESSPLKGVNLRADPNRREAAVDGFTRLIEAMVAVQLYDQNNPDDAPRDITLIQAESDKTAKLFGSTLHSNSNLPGSSNSSEHFILRATAPDKTELDVTVHRSVLQDYEIPYYTVIASAGQYVVQISGSHSSVAPFDDYVMKVLLALH